MNTRLWRRQLVGDRAPLVLDYEAISPVTHVADPVGRGAVVEQLFDYLDPALAGGLPPNAYVWGPPGSGKSALCSALFSQIKTTPVQPGAIIHATSRAQVTTAGTPTFVYVDSRGLSTDCGLYKAILDSLVDEPIPGQGISPAILREQLQHVLAPVAERAVVAVDHVGEPNTAAVSTVDSRLDPVDSLSWVAIGRTPPAELEEGLPDRRINVPAYGEHTLADVVMSRAESGLVDGGLPYPQSHEIAEWADGNAHDALAALFLAADRGDTRGRSQISGADVEAAVSSVPRAAVSLSRVFALSPNRQRVLRALLDAPGGDCSSVADTADAIVADGGIDLASGPVTRLLSELVERAVLERRGDEPDGEDHQPAALDPQFSTRVFRRLHELNDGE